MDEGGNPRVEAVVGIVAAAAFVGPSAHGSFGSTAECEE